MGLVPTAKLRGPWDVSELDDLWTPKDSPAQLARFFEELRSALEAG